VQWQHALDESRKVYLRIWRSVNVNICLLFFRGGASRWVHDCGVSFFLLWRRIYDCGVAFFFVRRRIDSCCFLLACREQTQHSQQINAFFHTTWIVYGSSSVASPPTLFAELAPAGHRWAYAFQHERFQLVRHQAAVAIYGVGAGAVDPSGTGDGASVEPCVFGGFLFADLLDAGVGDGLLIAAVEVLVPVVPECSHDDRNAMPIRTAIKEITCFIIIFSVRAAQTLWLS